MPGVCVAISILNEISNRTIPETLGARRSWRYGFAKAEVGDSERERRTAVASAIVVDQGFDLGRLGQC